MILSFEAALNSSSIKPVKEHYTYTHLVSV